MCHDRWSVQAFPAGYSLDPAARIAFFARFLALFPWIPYWIFLFPSLVYLQNFSIIGGIESFSSGVAGGHLAEFFV